jgi:hypothetical protein
MSDTRGPATYTAIPLADRGFVTSTVRWYVQREDREWPVLGPYSCQDAAEFAARELTAADARRAREESGR